MATEAKEASLQTAEIIERLVLGGDLSQLNPVQKVQYYNKVCSDIGLNPLTKPFQIIRFQGREILYATKDCTEQLRKIHGVSICALDKLLKDDVYIVTASAQDRTGRQDAATGVVFIGGLKGDALANAIMKAESKAKRRVTLSICGLGLLDDSETDTIGEYKKIDITTGEVFEATEKQKENSPPKTYNLVKIEAEKNEIVENIKSFDDINKLQDYCMRIKDTVKGFHDKEYSTMLHTLVKSKREEISNLIEQEDIPQ